MYDTNELNIHGYITTVKANLVTSGSHNSEYILLQTTDEYKIVQYTPSGRYYKIYFENVPVDHDQCDIKFDSDWYDRIDNKEVVPYNEVKRVDVKAYTKWIDIKE